MTLSLLRELEDIPLPRRLSVSTAMQAVAAGQVTGALRQRIRSRGMAGFQPLDGGKPQALTKFTGQDIGAILAVFEASARDRAHPAASRSARRRSRQRAPAAPRRPTCGRTDSRH